MQRPVRTIKRPIYFGDIQHESHVKKPRNRNKTQNTPVQRHSQRTNTSSIEEQPGPSNQTSNVVVPRKTGPKLRRSCVMEAFSTFFFKKATSPKFKSSRKSEYNQSSTHYIGGKDLWNISLVNQYFAFYFRQCIKKANLPLSSQLVCNTDRYIIRYFFGFGARVNSKVMNLLLDKNRLPLFDTVIARSFDEAKFAYYVPAKVLEITVLNLPLSQKPDFNFCNRYIYELRLVISSDTIEYGLELLTNLKNLFPNLDFVKVTYFCSNPSRKALAATQLDHRLRTFACALKKDNIGIDEFSNVFNDYVFKVYPVVPFKIDMIYRRDNLVAKENRHENLEAMTPTSFSKRDRTKLLRRYTALCTNHISSLNVNTSGCNN